MKLKTILLAAAFSAGISAQPARSVSPVDHIIMIDIAEAAITASCPDAIYKKAVISEAIRMMQHAGRWDLARFHAIAASSLAAQKVLIEKLGFQGVCKLRRESHVYSPFLIWGTP